MKHELRLHNEPFEMIKNGGKTVELRLYDEKRRLINEGDIIEFTNRVSDEKMMVDVLKLHIFKNFEELYKHFDKISLDYKENEIAKPEDMNIYYSKEEQDRYGVVGIEIKKMNN